jgi:hypothetical protein
MALVFPIKLSDEEKTGDAATARSIPAVVFSERKALLHCLWQIITGREIQGIGSTCGNGPRRIICPTERCNAADRLGAANR